MASDNVQFDEDQIDYGKKSGRGMPGAQPKMVQWFIDKGVVQTPAAAKGLMAAIVVLAWVVIIYIFMHYL
ncbi:MAG: hypothetical protein ABSF56_02190 [Minisyncoccia bacterium]|jgi:hypothetical protein